MNLLKNGGKYIFHCKKAKVEEDEDWTIQTTPTLMNITHSLPQDLSSSSHLFMLLHHIKGQDINLKNKLTITISNGCKWTFVACYSPYSNSQENE